MCVCVAFRVAGSPCSLTPCPVLARVLPPQPQACPRPHLLPVTPLSSPQAARRGRSHLPEGGPALRGQPHPHLPLPPQPPAAPGTGPVPHRGDPDRQEGGGHCRDARLSGPSGKAPRSPLLGPRPRGGFLVRPSPSVRFLSFPGKRNANPTTRPPGTTASTTGPPSPCSSALVPPRAPSRALSTVWCWPQERTVLWEAGREGSSERHSPTSTARRGGYPGPGRTYLQGTDGYKAAGHPEQRQ